MRKQFIIPEINVSELLLSAEICDDELMLNFSSDCIYDEKIITDIIKNNCPMFDQTLRILAIYPQDEVSRDLYGIFVRMDFSGIFNRPDTEKTLQYKRMAELMFSPDGIQLDFGRGKEKYVAFERSASMSRHSRIYFVREDLYAPLKNRITLGMKTGKCQLSKYYAYNGLMLSDSLRFECFGLINSKYIIVVDNPSYKIPGVSTVTVEDDGTDNPVRKYKRIEKISDIDIIGFDGEGLVSPGTAKEMSRVMREDGHHSFQIRLPYIKGVLHEVDFKALYKELGAGIIKDMWGREHNIDEVEIILTRSMVKCLTWMKESRMSWDDYCMKCKIYGHSLYISGCDSLSPEKITELNYQFINTANITGEEFRPADLPYTLESSPEEDPRQWITKTTETEYYNYLKNRKFQKDYLIRCKDSKIPDARSYQSIIVEENPYFMGEKVYTRELLNGAAAVLSKFSHANLYIKGDVRYLSDDLIRLLAEIVRDTYPGAYKALSEEFLSGSVFYAPDPPYPPGETCTILRNPHIARNEEVIAKPLKKAGYFRNKYLSFLSYTVMVDSRSLIPERLGGADFDGDKIKTIYDPLFNRCIRRNSGDENSLKLLKIPAAEPLIEDAGDWHARFRTIKNTFENRVGQISNAALRISIRAYDENSDDEKRLELMHKTETLAILTGLEIDSAKSGIKPDLTEYLTYKRSDNLYLRYKQTLEKGKREREEFFGSVDWDKITSNLEKIPYYVRMLGKNVKPDFPAAAADEQLFALSPGEPEEGLMLFMKSLIADYKEAVRRTRFLNNFVPEEFMRISDIKRILFTRNQDDRFNPVEFYHLFEYVPEDRIRKARKMLKKEWIFMKPEKRVEFIYSVLDSVPSDILDVFCDFSFGGYRIFGDIICDLDDRLSNKEMKIAMKGKKDDSICLRQMMNPVKFTSDWKENIIKQCLYCISPPGSSRKIDFAEAAKCAVLLGERDFLIEVMPAAVYRIMAEYKEP